MKIKKQPETELEYWETIYGLITFISRMTHGLAEGRIKDPKGDIDKEIKEAQKTSNRFKKELSKKFGVILPENYPKVEMGQKLPPPPKGKTYYWNWYYKMKAEYYKKKKVKLHAIR